MTELHRSVAEAAALGRKLAEARANRHGSPCPDWCTTDHGPRTLPGKGIRYHVDSHNSEPVGPADGPAAAKAELFKGGLPGMADTTEVSVRYGAKAVYADAGDAVRLAGLIEALAGRPAAEVRLLADAVRAAASAAAAGEAS